MVCEASRDTRAAAWRHEALVTGDRQPGRSRTAFTCRRLPAEHQAVQCMTQATAQYRHEHAGGFGAAEVPFRRYAAGSSRRALPAAIRWPDTPIGRQRVNPRHEAGQLPHGAWRASRRVPGARPDTLLFDAQRCRLPTTSVLAASAGLGRGGHLYCSDGTALAHRWRPDASTAQACCVSSDRLAGRGRRCPPEGDSQTARPYGRARRGTQPTSASAST